LSKLKTTFFLYEKIKHTIKKIIPSSLIQRNEEALRKVVSLAYIGNKHQCNVCGFKMSKFITLANMDKLCPRCGSLPRTRRLWNLLENELQGKNILHFSPSKRLRKNIESIKNIQYTTTDYAGEFDAMKKLNIEDIDEPDNTFDLIICYHVLEHIEQDLTAMKELNRILKPNGICMIQTPFKDGAIYENENVKTEAERLAHFGQKDHVRIYSPQGLIDRLQSVGFKTDLKTYENSVDNKLGFSISEKIIIAQK